MRPDIFDVLSVSLSEDVYSSLIVSILKRSGEITSCVFQELTGQALIGEADVRFRKEIGIGPGQYRPDIVVQGPTAKGMWMLVIEAKIESGEGCTQTRKYLQECDKKIWNGECGGYSLFFLTLNGEPAEDKHWKPLTHRQLAQVVSEHDRTGLLEKEPLFSTAWRAYVARLDHLETFNVPGDEEPFVDWLLNTPDEYFVTRRQRAYRLGRRLLPANYTVKSGVNIAMGREQFLVLAWLPWWQTGYWESGMRLEEGIQGAVKK